jgi:chaperonin GroEL (HSP60 family)
MSHKQALFSAGAREKVLRGATALADAVRVTLGPKSKCVLIEQKWGHPLVCNDGVTIAKQFDLCSSRRPPSPSCRSRRPNPRFHRKISKRSSEGDR